MTRDRTEYPQGIPPHRQRVRVTEVYEGDYVHGKDVGAHDVFRLQVQTGAVRRQITQKPFQATDYTRALVSRTVEPIARPEEPATYVVSYPAGFYIPKETRVPSFGTSFETADDNADGHARAIRESRTRGLAVLTKIVGDVATEEARYVNGNQVPVNNRQVPTL
jgi:hypothetical protein